MMLTEHCTIGNVLGEGHQDRGCPLPCRKQAYSLKDRLNMHFPLESVENCRMFIFNSKVLNMLEQLSELLAARVNWLRIEARREEAYWVKKVVQVYRAELTRAEKGAVQPLPESMAILEELSPAGFTKGHYFRGVE